MNENTFRFELKDLRLSRSSIEAALGYADGEDKSLVDELIDEILKESAEISDIKAQYQIFNKVYFNRENKTVSIENHQFNIEKIVFGQLKKAGSIAVFICTAGAEIGLQSRKAMNERDLLKGYIYDVIGSEIVESAADLMQEDLEKKMLASGKKITNRYSPGYCNWNVSEQHKLFSLLPDNFCGIRLTPSALMDPVKSVSGFIGIGENVVNNAYTCRMCNMNDCVYRKIRENRVANKEI